MIKRFLILFGMLVVLVGSGCGEEAGDTTVIRETAADGDSQALEDTQDEIDELRAELKKEKQDDESAAAEPPPEPEPEPEAEPTSSAPDVVGQRLDIAKKDLKAAGFRARVSGGGVFGVVLEENWVVCDQQPPDGDRVDINVDRSC